MATDLIDAEREVAVSKLRLHESLRRVGESGTRLASRVTKDMKPVVLVATAVGVVVLAAVVLTAARGGRRRGWRVPSGPSLSGELVRGIGTWLVRAVAARLAVELVARLGPPAAPSLAATQ